MALFTTYKAPPASGLLGPEWRKGDGGAAQTGGLGVESQYNTYSAQYNSGLATSLNHFDSVKYTAYWTGTDGHPVKPPDASIPRLNRKNTRVRAHITDSEHEELNTQTGGESLYYATKTIEGDATSSKVLPSRPMWHEVLWPRNGTYKRDIYHRNDTGSWAVKSSDKAVSIFRMVYTDDQGVDDEQNRNVFLAFGTNTSHGTTATGGSKRLENENGFVPGGGTLNPLSNNHNTYVSNAGIVITFQEYCHYDGAADGGTGLIDLTPFSITATAYMERNMKTDIYSPYGSPEIVDFGNQVAPIKLWPTKHLTGLTIE